MTNIGCAIARRLSDAFIGIMKDYQVTQDVIYNECMRIVKEQQLGDWLEMPDGSCYTLTSKVTGPCQVTTLDKTAAVRNLLCNLSGFCESKGVLWLHPEIRTMLGQAIELLEKGKHGG